MKLKKSLKWHHDFTKDWVADCFISENLYYYLRIKELSDGTYNLNVTSISGPTIFSKGYKTLRDAEDAAPKVLEKHFKELMKAFKKVVKI